MRQKIRHGIHIWLKYFSLSLTFLSLSVLVILLSHTVIQAMDWLTPNLVENFPSRHPTKAGIKSAIFGTVWMLFLVASISLPIGVLTAIYLEEYAPKKARWVQWINMNISNLAGMPSIVYGLLGLALFVRVFGLGPSLLSGALTLSLLILPSLIISSAKAIQAVPNSIREAAFAMGAHKWQVVWSHVLPASLPGILTGVIFGNSRAIGETAPLLMVGALSYVAFVPESAHDPFTVIPVQIFNWASRPQEEFHGLAAAGIIILLGILLTMNLGAVILRERHERSSR